uniref:Uncharacterized protein n=1 Tax=Panagrolaimus superbus TaxID=310955 RepID=A0A914Z123_9BILA
MMKVRASAIKVNAHINLVKYDHAIYCQNNGNNFGFALIFDHKRHCNYVFNMLEQKMIVKNAKNDVDIVENMFILPLINELRYYSQLNFDFRCFILKLLKSLDIEQKQKLAGVIIETKIDKSLLDCVFDGIEYNRSDSS